jgi:hypothetical protein
MSLSETHRETLILRLVEGLPGINRAGPCFVLKSCAPHSTTARARFFSSRPRTACTSSNVLYR